MPDDNTLLMTESIKEIKHMLGALKADSPSMPEQWATIAQRTDLEAPILVLMSYDPTDLKSPISPLNPRLGDKRVDIKSYSWAVPKTKGLTAHVVCDTSEPTRALNFLGEVGVVPRKIEGWRPNEPEIGLAGEYSFSLEAEEDRGLFMIRFLSTFGFVFII